MNLSPTEENYLKAIFKIAEKEKKAVGTNSIANQMDTAAASVTDMIKKLYGKYAGKKSLTQALLRERKEELAREEAKIQRFRS